jgi:chemotaxis methyl-accepting protein methylase
MSPNLEVDERTLERLSAYAASWTGFSPGAIHPDAIRKAARARLLSGVTQEELLQQAAAGNPQLVAAFLRVVSVGETYFFRHPEHFTFLATEFLPGFVASRPEVIRAWSAGCATGEETYSLAACLQGSTSGTATRVEVLGTDLLEHNVQVAREAVYGQWSMRASGPVLYPLFQVVAKQRVRINESVREVTRFLTHNLLSPPPERTGFHVIFCRNVLVYFSADAIERVCTNLVSALAPGGVLIFSTMDVSAPPPGLVRVSSPELNIFVRPMAHPPEPKKAPRKATPISIPAEPPAQRPSPKVATNRPTEPVAIHLRALVFIERGQRRNAERVLAELARAAPDYLPGILEQALLHVRTGNPRLATELMRDILRRTESLPPEMSVAGPENLPVEYYRATAQAFLDSNRE